MLLEFYYRELVGWIMFDLALSYSKAAAAIFPLLTFLWEDYCLALTLRERTFFFWAGGRLYYMTAAPTADCLLRDWLFNASIWCAIDT